MRRLSSLLPHITQTFVARHPQRSPAFTLFGRNLVQVVRLGAHDMQVTIVAERHRSSSSIAEYALYPRLIFKTVLTTLPCIEPDLHPHSAAGWSTHGQLGSDALSEDVAPSASDGEMQLSEQ